MKTDDTNSITNNKNLEQVNDPRHSKTNNKLPAYKNINYMKLNCDGIKLNDNDYDHQSSIIHKRRIFLMR